jgi:hypothetical protein
MRHSSHSPRSLLRAAITAAVIGSAMWLAIVAGVVYVGRHW